MFYDLCGDAADDGARGYVFRHHGARGDHRVVAHGNAREDGRVRADPDVSAQLYGRGVHPRALCRVEVVVERREHDLMPDEAVVADVDAALILKAAPRIDEHVFAETQIFAEVCIDGREQAELFVQFLPSVLPAARAAFRGYGTSR